jgi:Sigma-70, region 4
MRRPPTTLSMAFLVLLESLTPVERAVLLLRDVFDYGYDEIATVVGKSEDNCRQIAVRARRQVDAKRPRFEASRKRREELGADRTRSTPKHRLAARLAPSSWCHKGARSFVLSTEYAE